MNWKQIEKWSVTLFALSVLGIVWASKANAHDIVVSWTPPTTWSDGTVMPVEMISNYRLEVGTCGVASDGTLKYGKNVATAFPTRSKTTWTLSGFATGKYCVRMATKAGGLLSAYTGVATVEFTGTQVIPSAPTGVTVYGVLR